MSVDLSEAETGKRILLSPIDDTPYVVTKWVDHGDGKFTALAKRPVEDRLFVPLKTEHYLNFQNAGKEWELRGINQVFNPDTVTHGKPVELRRGYSTGDSMWGIVDEVRTFDWLANVPKRIDHKKILPGSTEEEFLTSARELLEGYETYIAFRVRLGDDL